jgi:hypothetical protein
MPCTGHRPLVLEQAAELSSLGFAEKWLYPRAHRHHLESGHVLPVARGWTPWPWNASGHGLRGGRRACGGRARDVEDLLPQRRAHGQGRLRDPAHRLRASHWEPGLLIRGYPFRSPEAARFLASFRSWAWAGRALPGPEDCAEMTPPHPLAAGFGSWRNLRCLGIRPGRLPLPGLPLPMRGRRPRRCGPRACSGWTEHASAVGLYARLVGSVALWGGTWSRGGCWPVLDVLRGLHALRRGLAFLFLLPAGGGLACPVPGEPAGSFPAAPVGSPLQPLPLLGPLGHPGRPRGPVRGRQPGGHGHVLGPGMGWYASARSRSGRGPVLRGRGRGPCSGTIQAILPWGSRRRPFILGCVATGESTPWPEAGACAGYPPVA